MPTDDAMKTPCPACDLDNLAEHRIQTDMGRMMGLAMGVALGAAFDDMRKVTELMCRKHRTPYMMAMVRASAMADIEGPETVVAASAVVPSADFELNHLFDNTDEEGQ